MVFTRKDEECFREGKPKNGAEGSTCSSVHPTWLEALNHEDIKDRGQNPKRKKTSSQTRSNPSKSPKVLSQKKILLPPQLSEIPKKNRKVHFPPKRYLPSSSLPVIRPLGTCYRHRYARATLLKPTLPVP